MVCRAVFAVSAVATCVELGFGKNDAAAADKANPQAVHQGSVGAQISALLTFAAAGAFLQLGFGYIEAKFKLLNYGGQLHRHEIE